MIRVATFLALIFLANTSFAGCWLASNFHGSASMSGDSYKFIDDAFTDSVFRIAIDGNKASIANVSTGNNHDMQYASLSDNTLVGMYQANGGITVETWSITADKKVLYSKVMNIPAMQQLTSTKAFVGDVIGTCTN